MRYFYLPLVFLALVPACSDDDSNGGSPPPGQNVSGADLCASINKRAAACQENQAQLEDCTKNVNFLACVYEPAFLPKYSECRGNTVCSAKAGDDACVLQSSQAVDAAAVSSCIAKSDACDDGPDEWDDEVCVYPAFKSTFKQAMEACIARTGCAEQKNCINNVIQSIQTACPK